MLKPYLLSLGAGVLVGVVYSLLHVRSPAPPLVALVGLLGILVGEQFIPVAQQMATGAPLRVACEHSRTFAHIFGKLPGKDSEPGALAQGEPQNTGKAS